MIEYRYASDEHRRDVIDFINYVFSQAACPHDFKTLIPKVYADGRGYADIHAIVLEDNYVRGVVAQLPNEFTYGGRKLKTGYIGSVSTYKYSRGSGYMIKLMEMQAENAVKQGIDVMLLGGQRQRYEYYGYSPIGGQYRYDFVHANIHTA
ncbi:MAG: GNAT family N-acetyltransferase [Clostridiales bacterium]|nr:GNAT family N-acetyltransferase [Clostridiales bacterium]